MRRSLQLCKSVGRSSSDPDLWASASVDEVVTVVTRFWDPGPDGGEARRQLRAHLRNADIPEVEHCPFVCDADETPHPELLLLDWVLLAVDELDTQRHAGALRAMETAQEEVSASEAQYMETMALSEAELCGARGGVIPADFMLWADGAYSYCDYVLRGVARSAKLVDPPSGYRDVDSG